MKLASLKSDPTHGRDGTLVVVSDDLAWYADAGAHRADVAGGARRLGPGAARSDRARDRSSATEAIPLERFHEHDAASPLPRAYQWADGSAYVNHVALVRQARNAEMPDSFWHDPLMYQGGSDGFLGPRDPIPLADESWGCDLEAEVVVVTGDVPLGATRDEALAAIRLVGLTNDVSLRNLIPAEMGKGFGFFQSKPASAFSPRLRHPRRAGRLVARRQAAPQADGRSERPAVRPGRGGRGHDVRFRHADRACRQDPQAGRGDDRRVGHRIEPGCRRRPRQADRGRRRRLFVHRGGAHDRDDHRRRRRSRRS